MAHVNQHKEEQSLNLCGNLDGNLEHGELPNVNPFYMGNVLIEIMLT